MVEIITFEFEKHFEKVFELWQSNFGKDWPLDSFTFRHVISDNPTVSGLSKWRFVALADSSLAGFVLFQSSSEDSSGNLSLVMVDPTYQRRGIGAALHGFALEQLRKSGVRRVQLGGGSPGLWQGVPDDLSSAAAFFEKMGWAYSEISYDLIQDLQTFSRATEFIAPVAARGIGFRTANSSDVTAITVFQKAEFPNWLGAYEYILALGDYNDVILVCDSAGKILGMVILFSSSSNPQRLDIPWKSVFGENMGALGCVGIAGSLHNKGTGSAMMASAMEALKARGVGVCYISWTSRVSFYEALGFRLWKSYRMSWQTFG